MPMTNKPNHHLISALLKSSAYEHLTTKIELYETHISWVILTGKYAYKIKKPLKFGFLDFSTLKKRHFYCNEELRLNARLAPQLYLSVVPITGSLKKPKINAKGLIVEYAVKMRQFSQENQFDHLLKQKKLIPIHIKTLANIIADFHQHCSVADKQSSYGDPIAIINTANENFEEIMQQKQSNFNNDDLTQLKNWTNNFYKLNKQEFILRKNNHCIRECHGDIHLCNIAVWNDKPLIFDCLEFNDKLRWIDVISEVAFTVMDLNFRNQHKFAWCFLNTYLEHTGDYTGMVLLRFYLVYRAMVRAKINYIQSLQSQNHDLPKSDFLKNHTNYTKLALSYTNLKQPYLIIMHGLSGSGKTALSEEILKNTPIIRLRSDVERKRLFDLDAQTNSHSVIGGNLYTKEATEKTYQHLFKLTSLMLAHNWNVLIDASFLSKSHRQQAQQLATKNNAKFIILDCKATDSILHERISKRMLLKNDASEASHDVLNNQIQHYISLSDDELKYTYLVNTKKSIKNIQQLKNIAFQS